MGRLLSAFRRLTWLQDRHWGQLQLSTQCIGCLLIFNFLLTNLVNSFQPWEYHLYENLVLRWLISGQRTTVQDLQFIQRQLTWSTKYPPIYKKKFEKHKNMRSNFSNSLRIVIMDCNCRLDSQCYIWSQPSKLNITG